MKTAIALIALAVPGFVAWAIVRVGALSDQRTPPTDADQISEDDFARSIRDWGKVHERRIR